MVVSIVIRSSLFCVRVDLDSQVSDSKRCPAEGLHSLDRREQVLADHSFCCDSSVLNPHSSVNMDPRDPRETDLHHEDTAPENSSTARAHMSFKTQKCSHFKMND